MLSNGSEMNQFINLIILENIMNNVITFATLVDAVTNAVESYNTRLLNGSDGNLPPTIGTDNRLHAPHDGYIWGDKVYLGGQYLPESDEEGTAKVHHINFCANVALLEPLQELFKGGSMGGSWVAKNGTQVAKFYAVVSATERTAIRKVIPTLGKQAFEKRKIVEVKENEEVSSATWKWSDARTWNKIMDFEGDISLAELMYSAGLTWTYEEGRKIKGQLREWYTGLNGKMVRYEYIDDTIYS